MPENIVIYARFSSHTQNEQSIEGQLKACHDYAKQNDYNVIHEYIDRAISGTTDKRPEFLQMIEDTPVSKLERISARKRLSVRIGLKTSLLLKLENCSLPKESISLQKLLLSFPSKRATLVN